MTNSIPNNDEIDLINLIKILWQKKLWIILSTIICIVIGGAYAFTAKQKWTSSAEIAAPQNSDIAQYLRLRQDYALATGGKYDSGAIRGELFSQLLRNARSTDVKRAFFEQLPWFKAQTEGKTEAEKRALLNGLTTEQLQLLPVEIHKKDQAQLVKDGRDISFSAETPIEAQDVLNQFLPYISREAFQFTLDNFVFGAEAHLTSLAFKKAQYERNLPLAFNQKKIEIEAALKTAKQAGIENYTSKTAKGYDIPQFALGDTKVAIGNINSPFFFMLGTKYLQAQLDTLMQDGVIYPPAYYQITNQVTQLTPILQKIKNLKAEPSYSYVSSPSYPITRDAPKRSLILVIAALLGGMLGCIGVLFSELFTTKREEL